MPILTRARRGQNNHQRISGVSGFGSRAEPVLVEYEGSISSRRIDALLKANRSIVSSVPGTILEGKRTASLLTKLLLDSMYIKGITLLIPICKLIGQLRTIAS